MRTLTRAICFCAALLSCSTVTGQQASLTDGYLRSSIEKSSQPNKRELLGFLDASRKVSDELMGALAAGDLRAAYALVSPQAEVTAEQFNAAVAAAEAWAGKIESYEYRNQALEMPRGQQKATTGVAKVWYLLKSSRTSGNGHFAIVTALVDSGRYAVLGYQVLDYGSEVPTWLEYPDALVLPE